MRSSSGTDLNGSSAANRSATALSNRRVYGSDCGTKDRPRRPQKRFRGLRGAEPTIDDGPELLRRTIQFCPLNTIP